MTPGVNYTDPLLYTRDLTVGYGGKTMENLLFAGLGLQLCAGQLVCFMGPNGIGKSTLLRTLAGLQKPVGGNIFYHEYLEKIPLSKRVSVVLTDRVTSANLTVQELVTYGRYPFLDWSLRLRPEDKDTIQGAIDQLRIGHLSHRKIFELSDGQVQMAMIARAFAQQTQIILLDEPTAHLDLNNRIEIMTLLRKIAHQTGKAVLVATHELDLALQTADLIWLTGKEKNILTGIPEDLVLNNVFDDIFMFKGFDLKTGKVQHELYRNITLRLSGHDYPYLWTKNALERNGYRVDNDKGEIEINILQDKNITWALLHQGKTREATSINELLELLAQ